MRWRGGRWTTWWYSRHGAGVARAELEELVLRFPEAQISLQRYGRDHDDPVLRPRLSGAHPCGEGGG